MKSYNLLLVKATLSFIVGILLQPYIHISLFWSILFVVSIYIVACIFHFFAYKNIQWSFPFGIGVLLLFTALGIVNKTLKDPLNAKCHYTHTNDSSKHTYLFSVQEKLKSSPYQDKYIVKLHQSDSTLITGRALLSINKNNVHKTLAMGQWYYIRASLQDLPMVKNPYQFDYGSYLKKKHIYGQFFVKHDELLSTQQTTNNGRVAALRFRESIILTLKKQSFSKDQLAIIQALLLGQRQDIDTDLSTQYASAGMMHILAVSGLHVGILLLLLRSFTTSISYRKLRWVRSGIIIGLLWCFAFITGLSPSVLRAVTMFSFLELGSCLGGKRRSQDAVLFSAFILLVIDPSLLHQVGFQLSYLAVIAILWIQPWLYGFYQPNYYITKKLWGIITVSIAAQIGVMPLSLFYFHQFPGLFLISNIVVLPFLGIILSVGILVICLSYFSILPNELTIVYGKIIDLLNNFIAWVASKEVFIIDHISISQTSMIWIYLVLITLIFVLKKYTYQRLLAFLIVCTITLSIQVYQKQEKEPPHLTIFHKNRETMIGLYTSDSLTIYTDSIYKDFKSDYRIKAYQNTFGLDILHTRSMKNYFKNNGKSTLIIDNVGVYKIKYMQPDYIVLRQSPKIHLERLITLYPHVTIVADGSNYKSDITQWKATCHKLKIPFHSTYEKGFFMVKE